MEFAIECENLSFQYGKNAQNALNGVTLHAKSGEIYGLLGPNGAGKTTFIKCLLDFIRPDRGVVAVLGKKPSDLNREGVAYLPERPVIPGFLQAQEFLVYQSRLIGIEKNKINSEVERCLRAVNLFENRNGVVATFSKGMLQRLGLAQVLLGQPKLILLDEPNSGLDPIGVMEMRSLLLQEKERGATIFINSHRLLEVEKLCDRFAILNRGEVVIQGDSGEYGERPGVELELEEVNESLLAYLKSVDPELQQKERRLELTISDPELERQLPARIVEKGGNLIYYSRKRENLEDIFRRTVQEDNNE